MRIPRQLRSLAGRPPAALPESGLRLTFSPRGGAQHVLNVPHFAPWRRRKQPYGGSDFFNCAVISDVSAATSGAMLQAAIANNISMIARVKALTLAAR
jgi:hypothetical protein